MTFEIKVFFVSESDKG